MTSRLGNFAIGGALIAAGTLTAPLAQAVRINPDGLGQALIYPYYTARSTPKNNPFATALSVSNTSSKPKAVKVRVMEGRGGATVLSFNLFLGAYDVWTAGVTPSGAGAGIISTDRSCTLPAISSNPASPTRFRNGAYQGDGLGDGLDRTYEGYFEVLEMGTIDPTSTLGIAVTAVPDYTAPNVSRPPCDGLPTTAAAPPSLSKPTGGLAGSVSYINVGEGMSYTVNPVALGQWSNKVQWSPAGEEHPNLADVSPAVSHVVDARQAGDVVFASTWASGRDAVSALFMADRVRNEYTVEPDIGAATDWILTMPTKRFYVTAARREPPFFGGQSALRLRTAVAGDQWLRDGLSRPRRPAADRLHHLLRWRERCHTRLLRRGIDPDVQRQRRRRVGVACAPVHR